MNGGGRPLTLAVSEMLRWVCFGTGTLACSDCAFDVAGCGAPATCGNGSVDGVESCDGAALADASCVSLGFASGTLACAANCGAFDTAACVAAANCGNGRVDSGEACDGNAFDGASCSSLGFDSGTVACTSGCAIDTSACIGSCTPACGSAVCGLDPLCGVSCGDCDAGEDCDNGACVVVDVCLADPGPVCGENCPLGATVHSRPAGLVSSEPSSPRLNPIEDGAWWRFVCAFGTGTLVGVQLRRCLSADVDVANGAAEIVGEAVAHQMTLYDVTPTATLAMGALLDHVAPPVRETLGAWLDIIAEQSADGDDSSDGDLRSTFLAEGMPEWLVDDLVARATVSIAGAKGCRATFMMPLFDGLEGRGRLGPATVALRRSLRGGTDGQAA